MRVGISRGRARETKWSEAHVGEINKQPCLSRLCSLAAEPSTRTRQEGSSEPRLQRARADCNVMQRRVFSGPYSCAIRIVVRL